MSPPARGRGLKHSDVLSDLLNGGVAPRAGAWIETENATDLRSTRSVAPRAGAWIETGIAKSSNSERRQVAPRAGAWIETCFNGIPIKLSMSPPARGRGLKHWKQAE